MKGTCEQIPFHFFLKFMMLTYADWYKAVYVPAAESDGATQSASKPAKAVKE